MTWALLKFWKFGFNPIPYGKLLFCRTWNFKGHKQQTIFSHNEVLGPYTNLRKKLLNENIGRMTQGGGKDHLLFWPWKSWFSGSRSWPLFFCWPRIPSHFLWPWRDGISTTLERMVGFLVLIPAKGFGSGHLAATLCVPERTSSGAEKWKSFSFSSKNAFLKTKQKSCFGLGPPPINLGKGRQEAYRVLEQGQVHLQLLHTY